MPAATQRQPTALIVVRIFVLGVLLVAGLYGLQRLERFLIRDPRFALTGGETPAGNSTLDIEGVSHASVSEIERVFAADVGRSVYLLPLAGRRERLLTVNWIRDASVARLWPNRVVVRVTERWPVAFLTLAPSRFALIDEDGVILPPATGKFELPVLAGVRASDPVTERRDRVRRMLRLTRELRDNARKLAEIDVSDPDNLKVSEPYEGRMITLFLGDHNFAGRYRNFVSHYAEIQRRLPGAATLDLRLEDRITVVE
jgi:cell division septal protein FtsQ